MKILEINPYKGKVCELVLEGDRRLYLHRELLAAESVFAGDDLSIERIRELKQRAAERRSYEYALHLLDRRAYSWKEMYDKLMSAEKAQEDAVLTAMEKLTRYGMIDDARYAESLARMYVERKFYGLRRAVYEMKHRGLSQEDIDDALAEYDDPEFISAQLLELMQRKYARQLTDSDDRKAIERVTASLVRRGYTYQQIRFAMEDYFALLEEDEV